MSAVEQRPVRGYAVAAPVYLEAGWPAPLPLPPGRKSSPPTGCTGAEGRTPTSSEIARWCSTHADGNVALRLPDTVLGIDVDDYADKGGGATLAALVERLGPLPATWSSTSRGVGASRIMFFTVPVGTEVPGVLGPGIEAIQWFHRYAVVAPSTHPDTHERYRWYTPDGHVATAPPHVGELVELPAAWVEGLQHLDDAPAEQPKPAKPVATDDSIAERINREHDWHEVLEWDGWLLASTHGDETKWTRPGKDPRKGISAVLHEPDGPFNVFTSSVHSLQRNWAERQRGQLWSYSMFGYLAATRHDGDRSDCARQYRLAVNATEMRRHTTTTAGTAHVALAHVALEAPESPLSGWERIDLTDIASRMRSGSYEPTVPTVLAVDGALPLLYPGRINSLFGESGGGKTWVALAATAETVRSGRRVLFVDYEDNAAGITERLVALGLDDAQIALVDYRQPDTGIAHGLDHVGEEYGLVVIDSTGEAMAAGSVDSNSDGDVALWFSILKRYGRLSGEPAVVSLDHVPKAADAPSSYAIGSQRKRAAVTGAAYRVDTIKEPAKGRDGKLKLTVAKDRPGNRPKGSVAAIVEMRSVDSTVELELHVSDAQAASAAGEKFRPTVYMERVSRWLEVNPGTSTKGIIDGVTGKREMVKEAVTALVQEGFVTVASGAHGAVIHTVTTSFRDGMAPLKPVDNSSYVPRPVLGPSSARPRTQEADVLCTSAPSPTGGPRCIGQPAGVEGHSSSAPVDNSELPF